MNEESQSSRAGLTQSVQTRPATLNDVDQIAILIREYSDLGGLLPRPRDEIKQAIKQFNVIELNGVVIACGALEIFTDELGEIRSLVVNKSNSHQGLGTIMVEHLIKQARNRKLSRLMALTYAPEFFHTLGFWTIDKNLLPEKVWGVCVNCYKFKHCDEIAVILEL